MATYTDHTKFTNDLFYHYIQSLGSEIHVAICTMLDDRKSRDAVKSAVNNTEIFGCNSAKPGQVNTVSSATVIEKIPFYIKNAL